jgi:DnaJ family protein B protein 4
LSDKQKRAIYDQVGEEGLKGGGGVPPGGGFSGFPGGTTFSFSSHSDGFGGHFAPTDPQEIYKYVFLL